MWKSRDSFSLILISGGLSWQWFGAGWVTVVKTPDPSHQTSGQWQDPWPFSFAEKNLTKRESNETSRVFIKRENVQYMWMDTQADSGRERVAKSHPHGSLNCCYWVFLLGFLRPTILICVVHSPYLIYLGILPCCGRILPYISTSQSSGQGIPWHYSPFDLQGAFLCRCSQGGLLTPGTRNTWSEQGLASSLNCPAILFLPTENESPTGLPCQAHLSPA